MSTGRASRRAARQGSRAPGRCSYGCLPGRLGAFGEGQRRQNLRDDLLRSRLDRDDHRIFVRTRFLQRLELAVQQAWRHEMLVARGEAAGNQRFVALEIDQTDVARSPIRISRYHALERGAGDDAVLARMTAWSIQAATAFSQGRRSSSVSGTP